MKNDNETDVTALEPSIRSNAKLHSSLMGDENAGTDPATDITEEELKLLDEADVEKDDDMEQARATLDNTDNDGEALNESIDESGEDLDVPGAELDDEDEATGDEDEENNNYSHDKQDNK